MPADHHHADDATAVGVGILTVSSSRTLDADPSGDAIAAILGEEADVVSRELVADDRAAIQSAVRAQRDEDPVDTIVTTGGTGLTPDDVTVDAIEPLLDRTIPGFGERFRARSVEDVGEMGMLSRATAGVCDGVLVFCLPGSEAAARLGAELIEPILGHAVGLASEKQGGETA